MRSMSESANASIARSKSGRQYNKSSLATELVGNERGSASVIIASLWRFSCAFAVQDFLSMKEYFVAEQITDVML